MGELKRYNSYKELKAAARAEELTDEQKRRKQKSVQEFIDLLRLAMLRDQLWHLQLSKPYQRHQNFDLN